jgi:diguanylate cyclase (GGDEF)-like protein
MKHSDFYLILVAALLSVLALSSLWEFWLEDIIIVRFFAVNEPESLSERWEYVGSIMFFAVISLILPTVYGRKLIARQQTLNDELKRISEKDYLTALYNRRKMMEVLETEIKRCKRYQCHFSFVMLDIDHFKQTNDTLGHEIGDKLLREFALLVRESVRESDTVGRWGGEEFAVVCPETTLAGAESLAEKLRINIEAKVFNGIGHKTASFGVAGLRDNETAQDIIVRADGALYSAKQSGRNRVEVSDQEN